MKIRLDGGNDKNNINLFLLGMYGYNTVLKIIGSENITFYNFTFGLGLDINGKNQSSGLTIALLLPLVNNVEEYIRSNSSIYADEIPKIGLSFGMRLAMISKFE